MSSQQVPGNATRADSIKDLEERISNLRDELQLQNAIYQSLLTIRYDPSTEQQLIDCKAEIEKLKEELTEARRAHHRGTCTPYRAVFPASTCVCMLTLCCCVATRAIPPRNTVVREKFGMPSTQNNSSASGSSLASNPESRPSTPSRKRTHSVADITPQHRSAHIGGKARYHSPSPGLPASSSPAGSTEIIDLTG